MIDLIIDPAGTIQCIYDESMDFSRLGEVQVQRASHCEPDDAGQWWADLAPVQGPKLGPYARRSLALSAELQWLRDSLLTGGKSKEVICGSF